MADDEHGISVSSRITLFNKQAEAHLKWQELNPFTHCNVKGMPKRSIFKELYGTAPAGSLSEQRAQRAQELSLREMLQLCELINEKGEHAFSNQTTVVSVKFGQLFELYNHISDKLLGTLLCARKHKFVEFAGETLFQGRDDAEIVRLVLPIEQLRQEIVGKIENVRCNSFENPVELEKIKKQDEQEEQEVEVELRQQEL